VKSLVNRQYNAGSFQVNWHGDNNDGQRVAPGIYFYQLKVNEFTGNQKMVLID